MLAIRLQRNGRAGYPVYRIVVQEANRHPLSGRIVAQVGSFNPHSKATNLDKEKIEKYLKNGAQPSTRVVRILKEAKIVLPSWVKDVPMRVAKTKKPEKLRKNQPKDVTASQVTDVADKAEAAPTA
ncbi:MAG: 30S ribosomal protein S16 [Candidatus Nomurabacteria bacterium]|jgi:small subunit ribosomal protein S16|nr:30S ribosomal protein S16 [Candidatus Nomurabacteria bacterium]